MRLALIGAVAGAAALLAAFGAAAQTPVESLAQVQGGWSMVQNPGCRLLISEQTGFALENCAGGPLVAATPVGFMDTAGNQWTLAGMFVHEQGRVLELALVREDRDPMIGNLTLQVYVQR